MALALLLIAGVVDRPGAETRARLPDTQPSAGAAPQLLAQVNPDEVEEEEEEEDAAADTLAVPIDSLGTGAASPGDSLGATPPPPAPAIQQAPLGADSTADTTSVQPQLLIPTARDTTGLDTLRATPPLVGPSAAGKAPAKAPAKPAERSGILGVHPVAILFGLVALHYFVIKAVRD